MKRSAVVLGLAVLHFCLMLSAFVVSFGLVLARFDSGAPPAAGEWLLNAAIGVLSFPVVYLALQHSPAWLEGPVEYLPFALNSLLWAGALYLACRLVVRSLGGGRGRSGWRARVRPQAGPAKSGTGARGRR